MLVLLICHVGDAGRSCSNGKSKAMLYCFCLRRGRRQWKAASCPPRMLALMPRSLSPCLSTCSVSQSTPFSCFNIHSQSRVCTTCLTSPVLLLPSLLWSTSTWILNLRPFPKFWVQNDLDIIWDRATLPCFGEMTKSPLGYQALAFWGVCKFVISD